MVVQCPTCQSKFRIADEKVTDKGVRVRCTSCKNVFQVKKQADAVAAPGSLDLPPLDAGSVAARPGGSVRPAGSGSAPAGMGSSFGARPTSSPAPGKPAPKTGANGARKLEADDLFGMSELTGDGPLGEMGGADRAGTSRAPPSPRAKQQPMPNFDDIDIEVAGADSAPSRAVNTPRPPIARAAVPDSAGDLPPPVTEMSAPPPPPPDEDESAALAAGAGGEDAEGSAIRIGAFKTSLRDPFEEMNLGEAQGGALELSGQQNRKEAPREAKSSPEASSAAEKPAEATPPSASRDFVSSALTGLLGATIAVAVLLAAALNEDATTIWQGLFPGGTDVVATRVVSGLYDTSGGKPVFYVRGRVENRSEKVRGPVRVVAELVGDSGAQARAEAIAGAEPTPEDVWAIRSSAEAEKLARSLDSHDVERRVQPGGSLPFFAVIPDPPADLQSHRLRVRVEAVDAWVPQQKPATKR